MASGLQVCRVLPVMRKSVPPPAQDEGTHSATRRCVQGCHADTPPPKCSRPPRPLGIWVQVGSRDPDQAPARAPATSGKTTPKLRRSAGEAGGCATRCDVDTDQPAPLGQHRRPALEAHKAGGRGPVGWGWSSAY